MIQHIVHVQGPDAEGLFLTARMTCFGDGRRIFEANLSRPAEDLGPGLISVDVLCNVYWDGRSSVMRAEFPDSSFVLLKPPPSARRRGIRHFVGAVETALGQIRETRAA